MDWAPEQHRQNPGPIVSLEPSSRCLSLQPRDPSSPALFFHPEALQGYLDQLATAVEENQRHLQALYLEQQRRLQ